MIDQDSLITTSKDIHHTNSSTTAQHGGKRNGAGRKTNSGKFKESTTAIRVPTSSLPALKVWLTQFQPVSNLEKSTSKSFPNGSTFAINPFPTALHIPFYQSAVSAGSPDSGGDDGLGEPVDLNQIVASNTSSSFMVKATGESMLDAGIHDGDMLIVDRSLPIKNFDVVIAAVNGELTVKEFFTQKGAVTLKAKNPHFDDIVITADTHLHIWGVVTHVIHSLKN